MKCRIIPIVSAVSVYLFQGCVETVDKIIKPPNEIPFDITETLNLRPRIPDIKLRSVRRGQSMKRRVISIPKTGSDIRVELNQNKLEILMQSFDSIEESALRKTDTFGEIVVRRPQILGDRIQSVVIRVRDPGIRVEFCKDRV